MIIDEFLYALGFKADVSGGKSFDDMLKGIDKDAQHTSHSMLGTITAGNLLARGLERAAEGVREFGADFLETAEHMENAKVTMEALYSTAAEGDQKFQWLWKFAQQNPVMGFDAAQELFMSLRNNGIDPTTESLKAFGDAAAAVPSVAKLIPQGISELIEGRYQSGGVLSPLINLSGAGKNRVYEGSYVNKEGTKVAVKLDFNDAINATNQLVKIFQDKFGGAMAKHADTWFGLTQRMKNDWMVFQLGVMNGGLFDELKNQLSSLLTEWEAFTQTRNFQILMHDVARDGAIVVSVLGKVGEAIGKIIEMITEFSSGPGSEIITTGFIGMLLSGKIVKSLFSVIDGMKELAKAESLVALISQADPLVWVIEAVAALAIGIGVLIKKWHEFNEGMLDQGPLHSFFLGFKEAFAQFAAMFKYLAETMEKYWLEAKDVMGLGEAGDQDRINAIKKSHDKEDMQQTMDAAKSGVDQWDVANTAYTKALKEEKKKHPELHGQYLVQQVKNDYPTVFSDVAKQGIIKYKSPAQMEATKYATDTDKALQSAHSMLAKTNSDNHVYINTVNVASSNPSDFWSQATSGYGPYAAATANNAPPKGVKQ